MGWLEALKLAWTVFRVVKAPHDAEEEAFRAEMREFHQKRQAASDKNVAERKNKEFIESTYDHE